MLGVHHEIMKWTSRDGLNMRQANFKWVPHTGNETWLYLDNPRTSMWIGANVATPAGVRRTVTSKKRMFWIEFSRTDIDAGIMLPAGQSSNKDFFIDTVPPSIQYR
jgi:hypothetical protein